MPWYEWRGVSPFNDNRNDRVVEPGAVVELPEHVAGPHPEFVEADAPEESESSEDANADSAEGESEDEGESLTVADAPETHWRTVVNAIEAGVFDGELDALEDADGRDSVQEAIAERRE